MAKRSFVARASFSILLLLAGAQLAPSPAAARVESLDQAEDHLIVAASTDDGQSMDEEVAARLLTLPGKVNESAQLAASPAELDSVAQQRQVAIQRGISERNARFFEAEADKLDGWADDLKVGLEREIKQLDREIKEARRAATTALTLEDKLTGQKQIETSKPSATISAARCLTRRTG